MKTIGLLGGMSWESTVTYYKIINNLYKDYLGGLHSAKILINSVDFSEIEKCQRENKWDECAIILSNAAKSLETAGSDFVLICTNTMHKVFREVQAKIDIPLISIIDCTIEELKKNNISKIGLLGTKYTMTEDFYKTKFIESGINVVIPNEEEIKIINEIIFTELCKGDCKKSSKEKIIDIINNLHTKKNAEAIILGCTEIGLLINSKDTNIPIYDTTIIHATKAYNLSIK